MCYCGDTRCRSCGPAQGNSRCDVCGKWDDDGGCDNPERCSEIQKANDEQFAEQLKEWDQIERELEDME